MVQETVEACAGESGVEHKPTSSFETNKGYITMADEAPAKLIQIGPKGERRKTALIL